MKKSKVSWPSDSMLCQVKMFLKEECPAKVGSNPPRRIKTEYAPKRSISHIPRIKWKRPPKFIINETLLVGSGGDSIEAHNENLRIASVLEVLYPNRSLIPSRPCVSLVVQEESYDDSITPNIRLTPIEDEPQESSHNSTAVAPDVSLAASAALMKTNEQGSLVDADLLIKILSDPNIVKNLMNGTICKPLESPSITKPRIAPQHDTSLAMDRNTTTPVTVLVQPSVSLATVPPLIKPSLSMNHQKQSPLVDVAVFEPKTPQSQSQSQSQSQTHNNWNINKVQDPVPQTINQDDQDSAKLVKNVDYFKNLIKEHGGHNESNNYRGRDDNVNKVKVKVREPCIYFGRGRGCKRGETCLFLHDRSKRDWPDVPLQFPKAKRLRNAATR